MNNGGTRFARLLVLFCGFDYRCENSDNRLNLFFQRLIMFDVSTLMEQVQPVFRFRSFLKGYLNLCNKFFS